MPMTRPMVLFALMALVAMPSRTAAAPADEVEAATQAWAEAFNSRSVDRVIALYAPDAVFWGTSSPTLRDTPEEIREYFASMPKRPTERVEFGERRVRVFGDVAVSTGSYTFTLERDGETVRRPARFSLTYRRVDGRWLIVDHHSSGVPGQGR